MNHTEMTQNDRLKAENARLRDALLEITKIPLPADKKETSISGYIGGVLNLAKQALKQEGE